MKNNKQGVSIDLRSYRSCKGKSKLDKYLLGVLDALSKKHTQDIKDAIKSGKLII